MLKKPQTYLKSKQGVTVFTRNLSHDIQQEITQHRLKRLKKLNTALKWAENNPPIDNFNELIRKIENNGI